MKLWLCVSVEYVPRVLALELSLFMFPWICEQLCNYGSTKTDFYLIE